MVKLVSISKRSRKLINRLSLWNVDSKLDLQDLPIEKIEIERNALITWLSRTPPYDKPAQFLIESLRASLLSDLHASFVSLEVASDEKEKKTTSWLFKLLAIAGTLFAICDGFDGIASLLGLFPAIPTAVIFVAGIGFAALSVAVFFGFDLVEISKNLDVHVRTSRHLLEVFLEQVEQIDRLKKDINARYAELTDVSELQALQQMVAMLSVRYDAMGDARLDYVSDLNHPLLRAAKLTIAAIAGVLFFSAGFFVGQSLAFAVAGLFIPSLSAMFWPVLAMSITVGLSALAIYWFVERPGLENLVGRWFNLDEDKINAFAGDEVVTQQKQELNQLKIKISRVEQLHKDVERLNDEKKVYASQTSINSRIASASNTTRSCHAFFKRSFSADDVKLMDNNQNLSLQSRVA